MTLKFLSAEKRKLYFPDKKRKYINCKDCRIIWLNDFQYHQDKPDGN